MKINLLNKWMLLAIAATVSVTACKKDKDDTPDDSNDDTQQTTTHTVEENKARVEASGVEFVKELNNMEDVVAVATTDAFLGFAEDGELFGTESAEEDEVVVAKKFKSQHFYKVLRMIASMDNGSIQSTDLMMAMKTSQVDSSDEEGPSSIQEAYDEMTSTFSWNSSTMEWEQDSTNETSIKFMFPSTETGTSNNATLEVVYTGTDVTLPFGLEDEYDGDVPSAVSVTMSVDGSEQMKYTLAVDYLSNGVPSSIVNTITMGTYVMTASANYDEAEAGIDYSFKNGSTNLMSFGASASGNISVDNLEAEIDEADADTTGEYYPTGVVTTGNAYIQVMDIKMQGTIAFDDLINKIEELDNDDSADEEDAAKAINDYINIDIIHTDNNEVIASLDAYTFEEEDCWEQYDWETDSYYDECSGEYYTEVGVRMKYPDGTAVDMETYFDEGFDDVIDELNVFIEELNADYDAGFDPIEKDSEAAKN